MDADLPLDRLRDPLLDRLHADVRGTVSSPADADWDARRTPWSRAVDQHPAAVVAPLDEADVAAVLAAAADAGATVAVQPTGHGAVDALEGAVVLRMGAFDRIDVDAGASVARVGAGVLVGDLFAALDGTGLVGPAGSSRIVSVAGLVLGSGQGWFTRLGGMGGQWLRRARIVEADGTARWIDDADPRMRMLRGAGGIVAIATELELALRPVADLRGGSIDVAIEHAPAMLRACAGLVGAADGLGLSVALLRMPDSPALPEAIRGRSWCSVHVALSDVDESVLAPLRAVAPLLADTVASLAPSAMHTIANDPEDPGAAAGWSAIVPRLDDATIDALVAARADDALSDVVSIEVRMLGGAAGDRPTVVSAPDGDWLLYSLAPVPPGAPLDAARAAVAALGAALAPHVVDRTVPTFLGSGDLSRALDPVDLDAIREVRERTGARVLHPSRLPA